MRKSPPPPEKVRNVGYPPVQSSLLKNGLTVLTVEDAYLPRVTVLLAVPVGRANDPNDRPGLCQLTLETLKEGTGSKNALEIAGEFDRLAIDFDAQVSMEYSVLTLKLLEDKLETGLRLLSEVLLNPKFPEKEVEVVKNRWKSHLIAQRSDPSFLATERLAEEAFKSHPYSRVSIRPKNLNRVTRQDLIEFHQAELSPRGAFFLFAGAIEHEQARQLSDRVFGNWHNKSPSVIEYPPLKKICRKQLFLIHRPGSVQSTIQVGFRTITRLSPDFLKLKLANQALGGGASSRIFMNLRERKGYTYGAYSSVRAYRHHGFLVVSTNVRAETARESLDEIFAEMNRLCEEEPSQEEFKRCQSEIIGGFLRRMELPGSIGQMELTRRLMGLPRDYYRNFVPNLNAVTSQDASDTFKKLSDPRETLTVIVGDRNVVGESLQSFGDLTILDADGNVIEEDE